MLPKPGDLINIDKKTPGVIIAEKSNYNKSWGYMLCNLEPDQNALVLETYVPSISLNSKPSRKADILLRPEQEKLRQKNADAENPIQGMLILVVALGEHIVELVWSEDSCSIVSL